MKLVILDRDGVINEDSDDYIKSAAEWRPIPGSLKAIARLNAAGYTVAVATNQSGIARGMYNIETLNAIHKKMQQVLQPVGGYVDKIFYCPHGPDDGCDCRKPKAGLFKQVSMHYGTDLHGVPAIGDSLRDIQAAMSAGAKPVLVRTGKGERTLVSRELPDDVPVYANLADAVDAMLADNTDH